MWFQNGFLIAYSLSELPFVVIMTMSDNIRSGIQFLPSTCSANFVAKEFIGTQPMKRLDYFMEKVCISKKITSQPKLLQYLLN